MRTLEELREALAIIDATTDAALLTRAGHRRYSDAAATVQGWCTFDGVKRLLALAASPDPAPSQQEALTDGFAMVPKRPTREMVEAFQRGYQGEQRKAKMTRTMTLEEAGLRAMLDAAPRTPGRDVEAGPRTEFVLTELRSALNAMLTFFGMDEDEDSKALFDKARQAYDYAEIVMRPLEPWERQSLEDFRACVHRWHEKAIGKGYDGVEAMCDTAPLASNTPAHEYVEDLAGRLVSTRSIAAYQAGLSEAGKKES